LKKNPGLPVHVHGLRVRPLRKEKDREDECGGGNVLCVHSIDLHFRILDQIHWAGG
jgi:hypothetical protein